MTGTVVSPPSARTSPDGVGSRWRAAGAVAGTVLLLLVSWLVAQAVIAPGDGTFAERLAQAARDDGLGPLVNGLDRLSRATSPGTAADGNADPVQEQQLTTVTLPSVTPGPQSVRLQPALTPPAAPALPGEGAFRPVVTISGRPAVQVAFLRPDVRHAAHPAQVVWISGRLTRLVQHPGTTQPGRPDLWSQPPWVPAARRSGLVAAFDGGAGLTGSGGGFYADRRSVGRLTSGAASLVVYRDGRADVGRWGAELSLTPDVVSVRQNLALLVDDGRVVPDPDAAVRVPGAGAGRGTGYGWRSGVGVTASGDLVYAAGGALSAHTLATLLRQAGAVRAMQLDAEAAAVGFGYYSHDDDARTVPHPVIEGAHQVDRYLTGSSRDFFTVYAR